MTIQPDDYRQADKIGPYPIGRNPLWFGGQAFKRSDFQRAIADLKATRFQRFADNFPEFNASREKPLPDGWHLGGQGGASASKETALVKEGDSAAKLDSTLPSEHVYMTQELTAGPLAGKSVTAGVWVKTERNDAAVLELVYHDETTWSHLSVVEYAGKGDWQFLTAAGTVPAHAPGKIAVWLSAHIPYIPPLDAE